LGKVSMIVPGLTLALVPGSGKRSELNFEPMANTGGAAFVLQRYPANRRY